MKAIGVIPSRWGSTRLPGKSLLPLCGRPLVQWVFEAVRRAQRLAEAYVATDDPRILDAVRNFGGAAILTRSDHPSGTDRVAEAVRRLQTPADLVVNIQGDEPLVDPRLIDRLVAALGEHPEWDMVTAACPVRTDAERHALSVVKVVWNARREALYFSRAPIPWIRDPESSPQGTIHWRHIGLYGYRRQFLERLVAEPPCLLEACEKLEQLRALYVGARIGVVEWPEASLGVDTPEDVPVVERLLRERYGEGHEPSHAGKGRIR